MEEKKRSRAPIIITVIVVALILAAAAIAVTLIIVNSQNDSNNDSGTGRSTQTSNSDDSGDTGGSDDGKTADTPVARRNSQRKADLDAMRVALVEYQTNNRGKLPTAPDNGETVSIIGFLAKDGLFTQGNNSPATASWGKFYYNYVFDSGAKEFADPLQDASDDGYNLMVKNCQAFSNGTCGSQPDSDFKEQDYTILVVLGASCRDDVAVESSSTRAAAVTYTGEDGATFCYGV